MKAVAAEVQVAAEEVMKAVKVAAVAAVVAAAAVVPGKDYVEMEAVARWVAGIEPAPSQVVSGA